MMIHISYNIQLLLNQIMLKYHILFYFLISHIVELKDTKSQSTNYNIKAEVNITPNQLANQSQLLRQQKYQSLFKYITFEQTLQAFPFLVQNMNPFKIANEFSLFNCGVLAYSFLILNNRVYVNNASNHENRKEILLEKIKSILNFTVLPDMYFVISIGDQLHGNLILKQQHKRCRDIPLFASHKNRSSYFEQTKFLFPDTYVMTNWSKTIKDTKQCNLKYPYEIKDPKAFFIGWVSSPSFTQRVPINNQTNFNRSYHRAAFIELSNERPDLIYARAIDSPYRKQNILVQELARRFGAKNVRGKRIPQNTFCKFRYLLIADGFGASWRRLPISLISNSLTIKIRSQKIQWFYDKMIPGIHFVQIRDDLSDLIQTIEKLNKDKDQRIRMIKNANQLAEKYLTQQAITSFIIQQLKKYANVQKFTQILNQEEKIFLENQINKGAQIHDILKKMYQTNKTNMPQKVNPIEYIALFIVFTFFFILIYCYYYKHKKNIQVHIPNKQQLSLDQINLLEPPQIMKNSQ